MRHLPNIPAAVLGITVLGVIIYTMTVDSHDDSVPTGAAEIGKADAPATPKQVSRALKNRNHQLGVVRTDGILTDKGVPKPLHIRSPLPPMTTVQVSDLPRVDHGIPMPDGTFLPLLNGMTQAPPINREKRFGDPGPIVAKTVDSAGFEWWIHADGSTTTSKYKEVVLQDGTRYWDPAAFHNIAMPKDSMVAVDANGNPIDPANQPRK